MEEGMLLMHQSFNTNLLPNKQANVYLNLNKTQTQTEV